MSSFVVSARKYRPQKFREVIGQEHITQTLEKALSNDRLAHAFLFTGPRGVGKTTCARILAKVINCENKSENLDPCNECSSCLAFDKNNSFNVIELDAASNNGVEHIRTLNDQVRLQPQQGKYKVFIIDEVHMLSQAAFNAFLKTLEEPPSYAIFILATTEKHKIIPTILSRCQIFDFRRIPIEKIISQLKAISEKESLKAEEDALYTIAEKGDGSMRDALSIYDRIMSSADKEITYDDVVDRLNILDYDYFFKAANAMLKEDGGECLMIFDEIFKLGFEGDHFINGLGDHLRQLYVCKDEQTLALLDVSDKLKERYQDQAANFSMSMLLTALDICNQADIEYQKAKSKRLHIEMALLKLAYFNRKAVSASQPSIEKKTPNETVNSKIKPQAPDNQSDEKQPQSPPVNHKEETTLTNETDVSLSNTPQTTVQGITDSTAAIPSLGSVDSLLAQIRTDTANQDATDQTITLEEVQQVWDTYQQEASSPSIKSVLKKAILNVEDQKIIVEVPSKISKEMIIQEKGIMQNIRSHFKMNTIELEIRIAKDKFPDAVIVEPKKYLTSVEKYDKLKEENAEIINMVDVLGLKMNTNNE